MIAVSSDVVNEHTEHMSTARIASDRSEAGQLYQSGSVRLCVMTNPTDVGQRRQLASVPLPPSSWLRVGPLLLLERRRDNGGNDRDLIDSGQVDAYFRSRTQDKLVALSHHEGYASFLSDVFWALQYALVEIMESYVASYVVDSQGMLRRSSQVPSLVSDK